MTREEFDKLYLNKAVHCDTKEKANHFLALANSVGYRWFSGSYLMGINFWETHEEETYYYVTNDGILFGNMNHIKQNGYQSVEYQPQPKFKTGDRVRVKDTKCLYINGKIGAIEEVDMLSGLPYYVKIVNDNYWLWVLAEENLEKIEEQTYKEETIEDIIEEIQEHQKSINVLLNRLEMKVKVGN